ncbi:AraC family transcriptional regulator [Paraburkholderia strydomiana]|uniref:AraC family transcriptional regulator n=1 Tax=Paraburkholderia strydomiana TaxID=1245417 RepID=UPI002860CD12|nr:AraC family transcriptional regulator [Paraburkholderia strydomiana]MDR7008839.1 AraC family transcriptional activator of mtrCDE [Paraburkholderia strydomiana]
MELLDRMLSLIPVAGRLDVRCHFGSPWRIDRPEANEWEVPYHVLLRGEAVVESRTGGKSEPALRMKAGDILLIPSGSAHWLHDGSGNPPRAAREQHKDGLTIATNGGASQIADVLCGRFVLPVVPQQLMRDHLPSRLLVSSVKENDGQLRDAAFAATRLARVIQLMRDEAFEQRPGSATVVNHLSAALFALTLRCACHADDAPRGLLALAQRRRLQPALAAMFDEPEKPWTVPKLAELCHMSRATFVRHFDRAIGQSASVVLTQIRMALAGRKLAQTGMSVAEIGEAVGYQSEAAFQRTFKRQVGMTPAKWRSRSRNADSET